MFKLLTKKNGLLFLGVFISGVSVAAQDEIYLNGGLMQLDFDVNRSSFGHVETDAAARVNLGYFITDQVSVELGYLYSNDITSDYQGAQSTYSEFDFDGLTLSLKGMQPLTDRVSAFASVGTFFWDSKLKTRLTGVEPFDNKSTPFVTRNFDGSDLYVTVGLNFNLWSHGFLNLEYGTVSGDWFSSQDGVTEFELDYIGLGMNFKF